MPDKSILSFNLNTSSKKKHQNYQVINYPELYYVYMIGCYMLYVKAGNGLYRASMSDISKMIVTGADTDDLFNQLNITQEMIKLEYV